MENKRIASYSMLIGSMLIFGTIGIFRRYIPLSSGLLACVRGLLGALVLYVFIKLKGRKLCHGIGIKKLLLLLLTGALIGANWMLLFEAYRYTTVATATLCYYMQPTIVIFLSPLFFGEKLSVKKLICAFVSVVGMIFVSGIIDGNGLPVSDVKGILFGMSAAAVYASIVIMNKKIQIEDAYEKTIIQLFSAALILIPYVLVTENFSNIKFSLFSVVMIVVVGIVHTGIAYALYFASMKSLNAQSIAVLSYMDPVSALILSALVLKERLTVYGSVGAVLIIGSALISEVDFKRKINR